MTGLQRHLTFLSVACALATTGCGKVREISACRGLAQEVNPTLAQVEALARAKDPDRTLQAASMYGALAKRVAARGHGDGALASAVRDYAELLKSTESALRAHAEALRSSSSARTTETRRDLERIVKRERAIVARLSAECHV